MGRKKSKSTQSEPPTAAASSSTAPPPWIQLPRDVTANILQRLRAVEILQSAQKVCTTWRRICQDPSMWRVIDIKKAGAAEFLCRQAVDRSQGQLVDLCIDYFAHDELLNYIADRSSHLRRLQLFSGDYTVEPLKKLPHLEELNLIITPIVEAADIQTIGISCPMLKSFTFCMDTAPEVFLSSTENNEHALAIAKTMPNLRHLRLYANSLNKGLEAILDGCPHLESLDLRRCIYLDLSTELGDRCFDQTKDVKGPDDSVSDIWWLASSVCFEPIGRYGGGYGAYSILPHGYYDHFESFSRYGAYSTLPTWFLSAPY